MSRGESARSRFAFRALEVAVCAALFVLMAVVAVDVAGRYLFNRPLPAGYELVQVLMGVLAFAALPLISRHNDHITLGLLDSALHGAAERLRLAFVHAFSAAMTGFVAWRLFVHAAKLGVARDSTAVLQLPLAPFAWFAGVAATVSALLLAWLALRALRRS